MQAEIERSLYDGMTHEQDREGLPTGFPEPPATPLLNPRSAPLRRPAPVGGAPKNSSA